MGGPRRPSTTSRCQRPITNARRSPSRSLQPCLQAVPIESHRGDRRRIAGPVTFALHHRRERSEAQRGRRGEASRTTPLSFPSVLSSERKDGSTSLMGCGAEAERTVAHLGDVLIAARVRSRAGRKLNSPALIADGHHARVDALVSAGVVLSSGLVGLGFPVADPHHCSHHYGGDRPYHLGSLGDRPLSRSVTVAKRP